MRYMLRDIPALLRSPIGRRHLRISVFLNMWPLFSRLAALYRRLIVRRTRVATVIGSFGKTTTTRAVASALCGMSYNVSRGNCLSLVARAVFRIRPNDPHAVIEIGIDKPGDMAMYPPVVRPDIVVVTSIGSEHIRSLGTLEVTRAEKAEMVRALPSSGIAVLNGDDENILWMRNLTRAKVVTYGLGEANDVRASHVSLAPWPDGTSFTLHANGTSRGMHIRLIGYPMVYAVLAAAAAGLAEGFTLDEIQPPLEALTPTPGRLEPVRLENGAIILRDDFKSPIETIEAALDIVSEISAKRRIVVLGEVSEPPSGEQGNIYRHLGARIAKISSRAIFLCRERDSACRSGAIEAGMPASAITKAGKDLFRAAEMLKSELRQGDVVLIKGRDTQRLDRITLALQGRKVGCRITSCRTKTVRCHECPTVETGWGRSGATTQLFSE